MFPFRLLFLLIPTTLVTSFISQPVVKCQLALSSESTDSGAFEAFDDEVDEVLLRVNFSYDGSSNAEALDAVRQYTKSFPFAAVLPVQPLTYLPVQLRDGELALKVTFLRKKTEEKDSRDGGMLFQCFIDDNESKKIRLIANRIKKGQTVTKVFSEKQIVVAFIKGLDEARGKAILEGANVRVASIFHEWM